ncbi:hypothetical protein CkaCkLH20_03495 [Colletotrichum karsti]|uniref:Xylanolytic transcriptional activator regulatory domain-containing protein n=1 Tax=Colletotrichum karsti TaxID=1095194 RepID=A0A9P6IBF4_9PEZI|nr:uncharacterized protein CkaCkLH20_03495 [Colletotrichum karsti]KAF9879262.1 hypothetical protein CkaCkLH20_03495 [Colletotrichum karsti]
MKYPKGPVNKVHRLEDKRADYDLETVHSIINQCMSLHVSFAPGAENEFPAVIPMTGAMGSFDRPSSDIDEPLDCYIHGYVSARMANLARDKIAQGLPGLLVCVSAAKVDGIVLALSSFAHSCNYRSASLFGYASLVTDDEEKLWALRLITDGLVAGRWEQVRQPPSSNELLQTQVLRIRVKSGSAKVRMGPVAEVKEDLQNPETRKAVWSGYITLVEQLLEPVPSRHNLVEKVPDHIKEYREVFNGDAEAYNSEIVQRVLEDPECIPSDRERMALYSVQYIESLEARVSDIQHEAAFVNPRISLDQPHDDPSRLLPDSRITNEFSNPQTASDQLDMTFVAPLDSSNNMFYGLDMMPSEGNLFTFSDVANHETTTNSVAHSDQAMPVYLLGQESAPTLAEVSIHEGALYFQTYFEVIHPRYPFLDVEECSRGYQDWKTGELSKPSSDAWRSCLIFAVGSLLRQAQLDCSTPRQHHNLMLQVQAEHTILTDHSYKPLVRLQAMLLYAIHALHGESTPRVVHILGVAMRFAVIKRFHCLVPDGTEETATAIKAWWCIYSLDKVVAITLRIPPYPPEDWITTPVYVTGVEPQYMMPWSSDVPGANAGSTYNFNLSYYAHMCRVRQIHSKILSTTQTIAPEARAAFIDETRAEIDQWSHDGQIRVNTEGYASSLGLMHVAAITRVILYRLDPADINSPYTEEYLQSCCDLVGIFRALQKKRQIPKHWIDMLFTFQAGVTMIYILYRRAVPGPKNVDRAIRDVTSTFAIFADRSGMADIYRDCLDVLASCVSRSCTPGTIDEDSRREISGLAQQIIESGTSPDVAAMLSEMSQDPGDG